MQSSAGNTHPAAIIGHPEADGPVHAPGIADELVDAIAPHRLCGVENALDGATDVAIASLAWWTILYAACLVGLPLAAAWSLWLVGVIAGTTLRWRRRWYPAPAHARPYATIAAGAVALATAALASAMSRPDWDDAFYLTRSTWVADHGRPATRDFLFTNGTWPATVGSVPNVSSIETLFGAAARYLDVATGNLVYRWFVPVAAFGAVWTLWLLLRSWHARRPTASLLVAMVFLLMGGYAHASWGNMSVERIWQGKVALVAVLVPYIYGVLALISGSLRRSQSRVRAVPMLVLVSLGIAAVGASSTAVFLVPLIACTSVIPMVLRRRWSTALVIVGTLSTGPVIAGIATLLSPIGSRNEMGSALSGVWQQVLADRWIAALVVGCGLVVLMSVRWPRTWAAMDAASIEQVSCVLVCGAVATLTPVYGLLVRAMGGDAIAYRLAWMVPVPAVVGLVASTRMRRISVVTSVITVALLVTVGAPIWSGSNSANMDGLGSWKVRSEDDLSAARWVVSQHPSHYLAANWVTFLVGTITSGPRPVGTRLDYLSSVKSIPGSQYNERLLLQTIADGADARIPAAHQLAMVALVDLQVDVACVAWNDSFTDQLFTAAGYGVGFAKGPWTCWERSGG